MTINKITRAPAKKREDPTPPPTRQQTQAATEASVTAQQAPSKPPTRPQAPKPNTGNTTPASYSKVIASVALTSPLHPTTDPRPASRISASGISRQQQCGPPRQLGGRQQRGGDSYRVRLPDISKADLFNIILADAPAGVPQSKQLPKPRFDIAEGLFDQYTAAIDNHDFQLRDLPIHGPITKDRLDEYIKGLVQEGMRKADIDRLEGEWMRKNGILIKCVYCIANKRVCSGSIPCTLSKAAQGRCPQGECYADLDCKVLACPFLHSTLTTMVKHGLQRAGLPVDMAYTIIARWMKRRSWNMPLKHYHKTFPRMRFETDYPPLGSAIEMSELRPDIGNVDSIPAHKAGQSASKWTLALIDDRSFDEWLQKQVEKANIALRHTQRKDTAHPPTWWFESSGAAAMFKSWDVLQAEMPEAYADVVAEFIVEYGEDMLIGPTIDTSSDVPLPSSTPRT